ncbi:Long chronological lifespan protein 2 [Coniosporium tulheliwenetii]|uniref:Long chronological lifespan protein 2 n=1 Tax=Coniosporium tulheliwenetii TaxID=3383036 RepID=A0ACC2YY40_9PEZI|nr:Long chronological lifespan protein 2 [Cladosporium sp. JES 115]
MKSPLDLFLLILSFALAASAQFQFFEQMFSHGQQQQQPQNTGSDSAWYRQTYDNAYCDKYLCPGTLSCGGWKAGEAARKIELARKGLL